MLSLENKISFNIMNYNLSIIIIISIIVVCLLWKIIDNFSEESEELKFPKIVWLVWFQGWDKAPNLVLKVRDSWKHHNPDWEIKELNDDNIKSYIGFDLPNDASYAAKSDIIRISLLKKHGGVWADATMLCLRPLDSWVYEAIEPAKLWMYHGRDNGRGPASWFIVSYSNSYIISKWYDKVREFWSEPRPNFNYFFMDELFGQLTKEDDQFVKEWQKVPFLNCEDEGSAHHLAGHVFNYDENRLNKVKEHVPYALKLSNHGNMNENTNGWHMVTFSFENKKFNKIIFTDPPSFEDAVYYP